MSLTFGVSGHRPHFQGCGGVESVLLAHMLNTSQVERNSTQQRRRFPKETSKASSPPSGCISALNSHPDDRDFHTVMLFLSGILVSSDTKLYAGTTFRPGSILDLSSSVSPRYRSTKYRISQHQLTLPLFISLNVKMIHRGPSVSVLFSL